MEIASTGEHKNINRLRILGQALRFRVVDWFVFVFSLLIFSNFMYLIFAYNKQNELIADFHAQQILLKINPEDSKKIKERMIDIIKQNEYLQLAFPSFLVVKSEKLEIE